MYSLHLDAFFLLHILYVIGISAESMTGAISAGRKNMDIFGVMTIASITALGGGSVRDMLLGVYPLTWIAQPGYIITTLCAAVIAIFIANFITKKIKLFLILDALGLVTFAYIGSTIGYQSTDSYTIGIIMGVLTGISGGMMRDILCNDIPLVLRSELYASIALIVGALNMLTIYLNLESFIWAIVILVLGLIFRLLAIYKHVELPKIHYQ
jgi:uncharacterized membrane protein YeiH